MRVVVYRTINLAAKVVDVLKFSLFAARTLITRLQMWPCLNVSIYVYIYGGKIGMTKIATVHKNLHVYDVGKVNYSQPT